MNPKLEIEGLQTFSDALNSKFGHVYEKLYDRITQAQRKLADKVRANLSGEILQRRSGALYESVQEQTLVYAGGVLTGEVTVGNEKTPYAPVQERGGVKKYNIIPVNKAYLTFVVDGKRIFTKLVRRQPLEARYYFGKAVDELGPEILAAMHGSVFEA